MSRFSGVDSAKPALRELERQRLERKIGNFRSAALDKVSANACVSAPGTHQPQPPPQSDPKRRFQPRRRGAESPQDHPGSGYPSSPLPDAELPNTASAAAAAAPLPHSSEHVGALAGNVELAWLLRAQSRLEEEAQEVRDFLSQHQMDRYAAVLIDDESGLGRSLEVLKTASDEDLRSFGLPLAVRVRLLAALRDLAGAPPSTLPNEERGNSRPSSSMSMNSVNSKGPSWGRLGRVPAGWQQLKPQQHGTSTNSNLDRQGSHLDAKVAGRVPGLRTLAAPKVTVDCGCGDDEPLPLDGGDDERPMSGLLRIRQDAGVEVANFEAEGKEPSPMLARTPTPSQQQQQEQQQQHKQQQPRRPSSSLSMTAITSQEAGAMAAAGLSSEAFEELSKQAGVGTGGGFGGVSGSSGVSGAGAGSGGGGVGGGGVGGAAVGSFMLPTASTSSSRPGTAGGSGKVCCYECFKQVYSIAARQVFEEDALQEAGLSATGGPSSEVTSPLRYFCSENCEQRFREALKSRKQRLEELRKLRSEAAEASESARGGVER